MYRCEVTRFEARPAPPPKLAHAAFSLGVSSGEDGFLDKLATAQARSPAAARAAKRSRR